MIGTGIRKIRIAKNISQQDLALDTNTSSSYLSRVETGAKTPSIEFVKRVSIALDVPHAILFWFSVKRKDVHESKREIFDLIKPAVDELIEQLFSSNPLE